MPTPPSAPVPVDAVDVDAIRPTERRPRALDLDLGPLGAGHGSQDVRSNTESGHVHCKSQCLLWAKADIRGREPPMNKEAAAAFSSCKFGSASVVGE